MIVRKLRDRRGWSQEQLAEFSGLHVRTIQRVERGHKASLETLKALASVLEVDLSTLTEEIIVIDRESAHWKQLPWWFRANLFGITQRKTILRMEVAAFLLAVVLLFAAPGSFASPILFVAVYLTVWTVRYGDDKKIW